MDLAFKNCFSTLNYDDINNPRKFAKKKHLQDC